MPKLEILNASNNPLQSLFIKNGINTELSISDNLNLFLICTEIENSNYAQSQCPSCIVTTNCDNQNTIDLFQLNSKVLFDLNLDGCIGSKKSVPFSKFSVTNGNSNTLRYSAQDGQHQLKLLAGSYTIEPEIDFPKVYNLSPSTISLNFPQDSSPYVQDFCFSPLEQINDLDVSIIPLNEARPGFNYKFKVLYENVGTTFLDGEIQLEYDSQLMDLIVATPMPDNDVANPLIFKFEDLAPWEKGCIFINMELNRPTDEPALLGGDILKFKATGFTNPIDDLRQNNIACLNQEVVNSFDPNDKTCIEGHTINQNMIGEYVHYVIRFENTGTADAINISVVDEIDVSKFDIRTLKITDSSHELATKINGNVVEFIMENINLPFEDEFNDGYIAFKIKTLPTLALGESFENTANIYFDFNFPIITNTTSTTVIFRSSNQEINEDDKETIKLFPNPTSNKINIESQIAFDQLSILNTQGQLVREVHWTHPIKALDFPVEQLRSSVYFLKLETAEGSVLKKFIVEK